MKGPTNKYRVPLITRQQRDYLRSLGVNAPNTTTRRKASQLIDKAKKSKRKRDQQEQEARDSANSAFNSLGTGRTKDSPTHERPEWERSALERLRALNQQEY